MHEMAIMDYNSGMYASEQKGERKGEQKGEQKKITEIVTNMKQFGLSVEDIAKYVKISKEEVIKIFNEQGLV
jgi:predicted transposase/invertase (TIGR01784 family)